MRDDRPSPVLQIPNAQLHINLPDAAPSRQRLVAIGRARLLRNARAIRLIDTVYAHLWCRDKKRASEPCTSKGPPPTPLPPPRSEHLIGSSLLSRSHYLSLYTLSLGGLASMPPRKRS